MELDFSKPENLQTRDGRAVRIYATDGGGNYPVHGATTETSGGWFPLTWNKSGRHGLQAMSNLDLIPNPPRVTGWLNVYPATKPGNSIVSNRIYDTKEDAANAKWDDTALGQIYIDAEIQS